MAYRSCGDNVLCGRELLAGNFCLSSSEEEEEVRRRTHSKSLGKLWLLEGREG